MAGPFSYDWDEVDETNRRWAAEPLILAWSDLTDSPVVVPADEEDVFFRALCPVCQFRVDSYKELKRRYDGVLTCDNCWDPEPRGYRRNQKVKKESSAAGRRRGAIYFGDDSEGR